MTDIMYYASWIPKTLSEGIVKLFEKFGYTVSLRMSSFIYFFIVAIIFYALLKSEAIKGIIKVIIFLLAILMLIGIFVPSWIILMVI